MRKIFVLSLLIVIGISFINLATAATVTLDPPIGANNFIELITIITDGVVVVISPVAVIMIIVAGILFLTSAGNPERINSAKTCLIYAVIGIVVVISAKGMAEFIETTLK